MAQSANNLTFAHLFVMKQIFCYLRETTDYVVCYSNSDNQRLYKYVDRD